MKRNLEILKERIFSILINLLTLGYYEFVVRKTHIEMSNEFGPKDLYRTTYSEFKKAFDKIPWITHSLHADSLLIADDYINNEFYASIITMNGRGYVMSSYGFLMATIYKNKKIKQLNSVKRIIKTPPPEM